MRAGCSMYRVSRPTKRHGVSQYVESVDRLGACWASQPKPLTRAEVAQVVRMAGNPYELDVREWDNPMQCVLVAEIQGYVGQDENDEAIYDSAKAWS